MKLGWTIIIKKKIDFFKFSGSQKFRKKSLIPTVYNTWVKDFRKWLKKIKICNFWPKWPNWAKNGTF